MTGRQNMPLDAKAKQVDTTIQADARSQVDTAQIIDASHYVKVATKNKKKHTNNQSIIVGVIGSFIIAFIVYNILINNN